MASPFTRAAAFPLASALTAACVLAGSAPVPAPGGIPAAPPSLESPAQGAASPARPLRQMVPAELIRIIDGDTVEMRALIWLDQHVVTRVRLRGIDAPERASRCPAEARRAEAAAEELERALRGRSLFLTAITRDKYGGRVVARIVTADGADAGEAMLAAGMARAYAGGKRGAWCG